jgi:hypothetical protein
MEVIVSNTVIRKNWITAGEVATHSHGDGCGDDTQVNDPYVTLTLTWNRKIEPLRYLKPPALIKASSSLCFTRKIFPNSFPCRF